MEYKIPVCVFQNGHVGRKIAVKPRVKLYSTVFQKMLSAA
jgi:hypothetical protein